MGGCHTHMHVRVPDTHRLRCLCGNQRKRMLSTSPPARRNLPHPTTPPHPSQALLGRHLYKRLPDPSRVPSLLPRPSLTQPGSKYGPLYGIQPPRDGLE